MAILDLTRTQSTTAKAAVGKAIHTDPDAADYGNPATEAEVNAWLKRQLNAVVLKHVIQPIAVDAEATQRAALKAEGWKA